VATEVKLTASRNAATDPDAPRVSHPRTRLRARWVYPAALLLLGISFLAGTTAGTVRIAPGSIVRAVAGNRAALSPVEQTILIHVRLPRVLAAALIGATLSLAGGLFQGLFRNPMADPYVLGTSGGAAFGAAFGLFLFPEATVLGFSAAAGMAFLGAMLTIFFVYGLARAGGRTPIVPLLLAGMVVSMILSEASSVLVYLRDEISWNARNLALWLHGSISVIEWPQLLCACAIVLLAAVLCFPLRAVLNVFALGEEYAQQLGLRVELARVGVILVASLLTAAAVLLGGIIGFVGLLVPHIVRLIAGPEHGRLLLLSAILGGSYLVIADLLARTIMAPSELPVGIITAFLGGPVLLYLLRRSKREYAL
jgi:iron complex transport system permease protein